MLEPLDAEAAEAALEEARRRAKNLRDLHAVLGRVGRHYAPGRVLVVAQLAVKDALLALGRLPPNLEFGAPDLSGLAPLYGRRASLFPHRPFQLSAYCFLWRATQHKITDE